jgi:hypothetical protein
MVRIRAIIIAVILATFIVPVQVSADYLYPGSAALQPLAVIEPATPDSLFQTWTGDLELAGQKNLGFALDYLRSDVESKDWDVIFIATGAFRSGSNLLLGFTVPYIIRDSEFNESDFLDLRAFARMRLLGAAPAFRISGELSAILPTAGSGDLYPFSLESPVVGARLAFAGGSDSLRAGINVGYQTYLSTESGNDSDLLYGVWMEKNLQGPWTLAGVYSSSTHEHSGVPGDDKVTDSYLQFGVRRAHSGQMDLGLAVGTGLGGDSVADMRVTTTVTFRFGEVGALKKEVREVPEAVQKEETGTREEIEPEPPKPEAAPAYSGPVVVMIAEGVTNKETEKRLTKALQKKGFATGMDPDPGIKVSKKNVLWYNAGMQEQAVSVLQALVIGGQLQDLEIRQSKNPIMRNWMILIPGGERK